MKSEQSIDFMEEKKKVFEKASLSCLPSVIRMGLGLTQGNLQEHVSFFSDRMVGLPGRLPSIYSYYRYFAYEVSTMLQISLDAVEPRYLEFCYLKLPLSQTKIPSLGFASQAHIGFVIPKEAKLKKA